MDFLGRDMGNSLSFQQKQLDSLIVHVFWGTRISRRPSGSSVCCLKNPEKARPPQRNLEKNGPEKINHCGKQTDHYRVDLLRGQLLSKPTCAT